MRASIAGAGAEGDDNAALDVFVRDLDSGEKLKERNEEEI